MESLTYILSGVGLVFLSAMVIFYGIQPVKHHVFRRTPPGIIGLTYAILTAYSIVLGVILITSKEFLKTMQDSASSMFLEGKAEIEVVIMVISVSLSLYFILGSLLRSYFNLHRIEEPQDPQDGFTEFISNLSGYQRTVEFVLRAFVFFAIVWIEFQVVALKLTIDTSQTAFQRAGEFLSAFNHLWNISAGLYFVLLLWDLFLLLCTDNATRSVKKVLLFHAFPVHGFGFSVAVCISLSSLFSSVSNMLLHFAIILSLFGIVFLLFSILFDYMSSKDKREAAA